MDESLFNRILEERIGRPELFKPDRQFYLATGIRQRRYGQLLRGDKKPTDREIQSFCNQVNCSDLDLFNARQLRIPFKD